ncbi:dTDP-glucose 4,6-dehydratase [Desulfuribacillus stibiiarsenatis]|uniref:dTDP-glucose 4,6-dehydratase n=1 Tax=Desulfuribacillus stibiiarsenatis TaxID=1390249 RepID=A0A1E5L9D7_9FIRM|nr:dTDP-glucose 4,6-dehydratase [Desulfuribacillus stibiiarsenatis]OEH86736.1 dTDP-glucose 4,6-dehydratase [Desulfuribacillus stibiiarsenatis]
MNILVTGGAGFIGSNFLNLFVPKYNEYNFINIDNLTYASNLRNLRNIENMSNYIFREIDISNQEELCKVFEQYKPDCIVHFAAESHVDKSIIEPQQFVLTNIIGTFNLLELCRQYWTTFEGKLFHHISTDEVYGSLGKTGLFTENTPYNPSSPYSASKASSDHLVKSYYKTYGLPVKVTNCSNNYGPYQFPEKLIPTIIMNALNGKPLKIYGDGLNVRDWLYVEDHCKAIWTVMEKGAIGETYNVGGNNEWTNKDIVIRICELLAEEIGVETNELQKLIEYIEDRPGHDRRYAIDSSKIMNELGWMPVENFETGLLKTIRWYITNQSWVQHLSSRNI